MIRDVTAEVKFGAVDDESLPLLKCVCGRRWPVWERDIGIYPDWAEPCPQCGRRLWFKNTIQVFAEEDDAEPRGH